MATLTADKHAPVNTTLGEMLPISVSMLRPMQSLDFNLYLITSARKPPLLFRERKYELAQEDLNRLQVGGHETLYMLVQERARYLEYLKQDLELLLADEQTPPKTRFSLLQECTRGQLDMAFRMVGVEGATEACVEIGRQLVELLHRTDMPPAHLLDVMKHDYNTATHMFNVSAYCVALAKLLEIDDYRQLQQIAVGGLLHDLGKLSVPQHIINKPSPLTPEEKAIIARHPQTGFEKLRSQPKIEWGQLMMVYQHHERLDGEGYPVQCVSEDIHWMAKLCSVVDIFDAMTCARPYRKQVRLCDVVQHLERLSGTQLDKEIVQCWISAVRSAKP